MEGWHKTLFGLSPQETATVSNRMVESLRYETQCKYLLWLVLFLKQFSVASVNEAMTGCREIHSVRGCGQLCMPSDIYIVSVKTGETKCRVEKTDY